VEEFSKGKVQFEGVDNLVDTGPDMFAGFWKISSFIFAQEV